MQQVSVLYAAIMGLVQGLTEYLPVSSSGHLAIVNLLFKRDAQAGLSFTIWLHGATLIAVLIYFRRDLFDLIRCWAPSHRQDMTAQRRIGVFIVFSSMVTGPMGLLFEKYLADFDGGFIALGVGYVVTTLVLILSEYFSTHVALRPLDRLGLGRSLFIGFAQGLAIPASVSRSGTTIAAGLLSGLDREQATRYSFLVGIPAIAAGFLLDVVGIHGAPPLVPALVGFLLAGVLAYLSIAFLLAFVRRVKLYGFAVYTGLLAVILLVIGVITH
jgi:undecaprenyl-diphosphatase